MDFSLDKNISVVEREYNLGISPVTLRDEFEIAAPKAGLTDIDTRRAQENAVKLAFM